MIETLKSLFGFGPKIDYAALVKQGAVILDVRTKAEWNSTRIENPKIRHVPLSELARSGKELCQEKDVVTFCHSSVRAYHAQRMLERKGCKNVKFLDGSLAAWPYKKETIEKKKLD